jgi:hypothetical protein
LRSVGSARAARGRSRAVQQFGERLLPIPRLSAGQQTVEERLHHAAQLGPRAAGGAELVQFGARGGSASGGRRAASAGRGACNSRRQERRVPAQQVGPGAALIDGEIIDHRLHGEGQGVLEFALGGGHDFLQALLRAGLAFRAKMKPMPPPDMPPSIQKPQKVRRRTRPRTAR